jgi:hypothetical protein
VAGDDGKGRSAVGAHKVGHMLAQAAAQRSGCAGVEPGVREMDSGRKG